MRQARIVKAQSITLPISHRKNLIRLMSEYARHARKMNHEAMRLQRIEDEAEFLRKVSKA
jgi:2-keto-4-pentenoate hydratase/2-oxohepta-3-ene-1,7-dioic acid hydratase in catechol pathway